jgi:hypothetical protein
MDWNLAARPLERIESKQLGPWLVGEEKPRCTGQIPVTRVAGSEGKLARKEQGIRGNLARGDVMVGVDRRGWNGGDPKRLRWSSTTAMVFRHCGSPAVDLR